MGSRSGMVDRRQARGHHDVRDKLWIIPGSRTKNGRSHEVPLSTAMFDLLVADHANTSRITFKMSEEDVRTALRHPFVSLGTDSGAGAEDGILARQKSHPRGWASTARILGKYVREEKLLTLEEAVRKMTSLAASRVGLLDRGILRPGMIADITVFDAKDIRDVATYNDPLRYSTGVRFVFVNGRPVVWDGTITDERPGRALRGPGYQPAP